MQSRGERWGRLVPLAVGLATALALGELACSTFGQDQPAINEDGGLGGPDSSTSADSAAPGDRTGVVDEGVVSPEDGGDAGANLIVNGDFEAACANWTQGFDTTQSGDSVAHHGLGSCRVCGTTPGAFTLATTTIAPPLFGTTYSAEVWVRLLDDAGSPATPRIQLQLDGVKQEETTFNPTTNWQQVIVFLTTPSSNSLDGSSRALNFLVVGYGTGCLLIDDAYVHVK